MKKKLLAMVLAGVMAVSFTACGSGDDSSSGGGTSAPDSDSEESSGEDQPDAGASSSSADAVTLQIGFENSISEPIGQALEKWQSLVEEKGDGSLKLELYPDSQLGSKNELIDGMTLGEPYITLADGAFYADYGVPDFGIVFGPFLFDDWDQCWTLIESDWYNDMCTQLEGKGLKIVTSNWKYGERHTLTTKPVEKVEDLSGLKIRVPGNQIQSVGFDVLGATSTGMDLDEVASNLILDAHVLNFTTWVMSADLFNSLTPDQQELLVTTGEEAGLINNDLVDESNEEYLQKMKDEGVTVVEPSEEVMEGFREKAQAFYEQGSTFGWSDGLYDTVRAAMGAK